MPDLSGAATENDPRERPATGGLADSRVPKSTGKAGVRSSTARDQTVSLGGDVFSLRPLRVVSGHGVGGSGRLPAGRLGPGVRGLRLGVEPGFLGLGVPAHVRMLG